MKKHGSVYKEDDTVAAISTPVGEGGIGIVRISGKAALSIADKIFTSKDGGKPSAFKTYTVHYGHIVNPQTEIIDEVLLTIMRAPKSYTREDIVEINCHGGIVPLRKVLELVISCGGRLADPGEFTKRAFLNGRIDLTQAEAVLDIIRAKTENSMKMAIGQLEGRLSEEVRKLKKNLIDILTELEAEIDFSEEEIDSVSRKKIIEKLKNILHKMDGLINDAWKGMILKEGIMCVICGKPNVGKSSLMNSFLKRNRVIVTPIPGTTRDAIEEEVSLQGMPLRVVDTAGIASTKNIAEAHGISKSKAYLKRADIVIFMIDLSQKWSNADGRIFGSLKVKNVVIVANKSDLKRKIDSDRLRDLSKKAEVLEVSLLKKKNIEKIENAVLSKIWHGNVIHPEGAFVTNMRQQKELELSRESIKKSVSLLKKNESVFSELVASDLKEALLCLGSILGDTMEPDILGRIFSKFCIGK